MFSIWYKISSNLDVQFELKDNCIFSIFALLASEVRSLQRNLFLVEPVNRTVEVSPLSMGDAGKGAAGGRGRGGRGKRAAQKGTDASSMTAESVASKSASSPARSAAAVLLALSTSTTAPVTPQLARFHAEVEDLAGSEEVVAKGKERKAAAPSKITMGPSSTSASEATLPRTSPRQSPVKASRSAPEKTVNWSSSDDVRMILVACCTQMQQLFELLGLPSNRQELQGSNCSTDARPTTAFFETLAQIFSDPQFPGAVPPDWRQDEHLPNTKLYALRQAREAVFIRDKWRSLGARYEVAWRRYSTTSGVDGTSCYCGCGKAGFWTTSGYVAGKHANDVSSVSIQDEDGDRKCVAPTANMGVYAWMVAMQNNACMKQKGSVAIPAGVRSDIQPRRKRRKRRPHTVTPTQRLWTTAKLIRALRLPVRVP